MALICEQKPDRDIAEALKTTKLDTCNLERVGQLQLEHVDVTYRIATKVVSASACALVLYI